ncbi:hypothetical protein FHR23_002901 [Stakelama sediminis]|uniref:Uncharacterized protein n=1 Tax=Stakelama sediminis TaxID=463200 RepID=A0A840Z2Q2_9SPHN|nr:hypothetical protein [Stakelama sediminis]MBB5719942.1 hypothetical protein [Stakelama sediminis]
MTQQPSPRTDLIGSLRRTGAGADLLATRHAGLGRIEPLTSRSRKWLKAISADDAGWDGDALVVELRYFPAIADAAIANGLTFESAAPV